VRERDVRVLEREGVLLVSLLQAYHDRLRVRLHLAAFLDEGTARGAEFAVWKDALAQGGGGRALDEDGVAGLQEGGCGGGG
jgi:hypothetical protein